MLLLGQRLPHNVDLSTSSGGSDPLKGLGLEGVIDGKGVPTLSKTAASFTCQLLAKQILVTLKVCVLGADSYCNRPMGAYEDNVDDSIRCGCVRVGGDP
jgi:hypothetical protein